MFCRKLRKYIYSLENNFYATQSLSHLVLKTYSLPFRLGLLHPKADLKTEHLISKSYKFVYICIPKSASRSLIDYFINNSYLNFQPKIIELQLDYLISKFDSNQYYFFTIVRNPIDRIISCYREKILHPGIIQQSRILDRYKDLYEKMPFYEFVDWLNSPSGSDEYADRHWISQHQLITDSAGYNVCNYIGKLENLNFDLQQICQELSIPQFDLTDNRLNRSFGEVNITHDIKNKIYKRYKTDFELFGYEL